MGGPCLPNALHNFNSISLLLVFSMPWMFLIYTCIVEVLELFLFRIAGISVFLIKNTYMLRKPYTQYSYNKTNVMH